ncbi:MAG: hypothetical protein RLZZ127_2931 [Planctomycetota bacterium]|jgi:hypothetical protein
MSQPEPMSFLTFLQGMGSQGLMQLGMIPHPITGQREANPAYARATLRVLELLHEKTQGNLSDEERAYLDGVLTGMRQHIARLG